MESDLALLPPRPNRGSGTYPSSEKMLLYTNLYDVSLRNTPRIHQYTVTTEPFIEDQGISLFRKVLNSKRKELQEMVQPIAFKGRQIWGIQERPTFSFQVAASEEHKILTPYEVTIIHTNSISPSQLPTEYELQGPILQVYNTCLREKLHRLHMKQTDRNRFISNAKVVDLHKYRIIQCYQIKLVPLSNRLNLLVDVSFRILNRKNALEELNDLKSQDHRRAFAIGKIVITTYNNLSYKVLDIITDKDTTSGFFHQKRQQKISYADYLKEYHHVEGLTKKQPLFEVVTRYENVVVEGKMQRKAVLGYLVPEVCRFAAQLQKIQEQLPFKQFQEISRKIKISPQQRKVKEAQLISDLNKEAGHLTIVDRCTQVQAIIDSDIGILAKHKLYAENGNINGMKNVKNPMNLSRNKWMFVYSNYKKSKEDDTFADEAYSGLDKSGDRYGIRVDQPCFVCVEHQGPENWIRQIDEEFRLAKVKQDTKIIVLLFNPFEKNYYGELKKYISNELRLPCQMILKKTISKKKMAIFGKILLQMNAKIGLTLWSVPTRHPFWKQKSIMYGGLSVAKNMKQNIGKRHTKQQRLDLESQNKNSHALAFVGTTSSDLSEVYANASMVQKPSDLQNSGIYEEIMINWIKHYFIKNKQMPKFIIVYREGLTEKEVHTRGKAEVEAMNLIVKRAQKRVTQEYSPQLIYIMAIKRTSKRVYKPVATVGNPGKFQPHEVENPPAGTIVFEPISNNNNFDFHICAQGVTEGTASLTEYRIAYDASKIPQEAMAQFTLQQCYNYPNWMGGIRVPGCLQGACKLSKLVGDHIHQNIAQDKEGQSIQQKPFYL